MFVLSHPLFAQTQTTPQEPGAIEGKITNDVTGAPIRKALVQITVFQPAPGTSFSPYVVETDAEGRYSAHDMMPGIYRVAAQKQGFLAAAYGASQSMELTSISQGLSQAGPFTLTAGQKASIDFKLRPYGAIEGRVFDTDGEPMWHAQVGVYRWAYSSTGVRTLRRFMDGDTDETGGYRIFQLPPGRYAICAYGPGQPDGQDRSARPQSESYVTTCYPGADIPEAATTVLVQAGQTVPAANFKMIKHPAATVRGRVLNATTGLQRGAVRLYPISNPFGNTRYPSVGPKGDFEISGVASGEYRLVAMIGDRIAAEDLQVSDRPVDATLVLGGGAELPASLKVEGTAPLPSPITILVYDPVIGAQLGAARLAEPGDFILTQLRPWRLELRFTLPAGYYAKSARMGSRDVLTDGLEVRAGPADPLQIVIGAGVATVKGVVRNEKDEFVPAATVLLAPKELGRRKRIDAYRTVRTDDTGAFTVRTLPPGDYNLFAWTTLEPQAWLNEEFMRSVAAKSVSISAAENGSYTVELKVIPQEERR